MVSTSLADVGPVSFSRFGTAVATMAPRRDRATQQPSAEWADRCQHEVEIVNHPGAPGPSARDSLNSSMASVRPTSSGAVAPAEGSNGFFDGMVFTSLQSFNSVAQTRGAG